jgi:glycosyltransferase involved in cell wall biosynthesis
MRLHSLLLALDAGLPFVPLAYSPKVTDFARAVGAADYLHPVDELDPEAVFHSCRELLAHRARVQAALREHRRRMQDASRISAELAVELLEQGGAAVRTIAARPALATRPTSGLRVLMQIRPDYRTIPGGDVVQLEEMLPYLAEAGIRAEMSGEEAPDLSGWDLVHTINLDRPAEPYQHCLNALRQGKPIALSTVHADLTEFQEWGDSDYWELPEPGEGYPRPRPAPPPHPIEVRRRALLHLQRQAVIDWATVYLPNAEVNRDYLHQAFNLDLSRAVVVPNGARERFFQAEPELFIERYGLKDFVLCVGRVEKKKNQLSLIAAMRGSGLPLVIVGRPNPQEYFDLCRRYADENVLFIESLSEEELASAYAAAKVHALVSWLELPGLTTLEAAAAGCNIVSTNRGSPPEYLLDMAWYCDPRRVESVREAVLAAYHAPRSDRLSRHIRECYHWRRAAERTLEAYQLALALHQATPGSERQEALLAATQRYADWLTRRAADLEYQVNVREAQLVGYRELTTAYRLLEADRALVAKELEKAHQELRQVTSRRLYRWSAAAARAGWGLLRALRIRP